MGGWVNSSGLQILNRESFLYTIVFLVRVTCVCVVLGLQGAALLTKPVQCWNFRTIYGGYTGKKAFLFQLPVRKFHYQGQTIPFLIPGHFSNTHRVFYIPPSQKSLPVPRGRLFTFPHAGKVTARKPRPETACRYGRKIRPVTTCSRYGQKILTPTILKVFVINEHSFTILYCKLGTHFIRI